jgi:hypothetical protein
MTVVQNFAVHPIRYRDARRDQRLLLPRFRVVVDGCILPTLNWSLGGLLLQGTAPAALMPDMPVTGLIAGENRHGPACMPFAARVIRLMPSPLGLAVSFADADERVIDFLEDCLLTRLSRHGSR